MSGTHLLQVDVAALLEDVSSNDEELAHASLRFLGTIAQLNKIAVGKQRQVIEALINKAGELRQQNPAHTQSHKVMVK